MSQTLCIAQPASSQPENRVQLLEQAETLMTARRSQSAIAITSQLLVQCEKDGQFKSPFGLKVRLIHGSALVYVDTGRMGLVFLLALKEDSKAQKQWTIFAETCRVIASELEFAGRKEESFSNLQEAQQTIHQYHLDSIYPHFAVRLSSWHKQFGNRDSSVFYAMEAIRTGQEQGQVFEEAEGHLLIGLNYAKRDTEKAIAHFKEAARLYWQIEEFTSFCSMQLSIASMHLNRNNPAAAMSNLDTAFHYLPFAYENNIEHLYRIYSLKGAAFKQMGQLDSAIFYLDLGHKAELGFYKKQNLDKIVEINNKYNVAQGVKDLETKNLQLEQEQSNRNWVLLFSVLVILFAGILSFYYLKLKKANKITSQQSEQLKNLDLAKSRFFANVSHELRTPLSLLLGPVNTLLKEEKLSEKQTRLLQMANRNGTQLQGLISEILDLQKMEMGKMELYEKPARMEAIFRRYCAQFESLAEQKNMAFSFETNLLPEQMVLLDVEKFRQILQNLLSNAFKFTPEGGRINARLSLLDESLQLRVTDSGPGIHPDDLPHVFDRFFQTNRPDKPAEGGTGIGLNLCQEYVRLFGGTISVKSTLGQGSAFEAVFPLKIVALAERLSDADTSLVPTTAYEGVFPLGNQDFVHSESAVQHVTPSRVVLSVKPDATPKSSVSTKPTILVVEDNPDLQDYIKLVISEKYAVISAENGQAALDLMAEFTGVQKNHNTSRITPDLILSDLMMPIMDGYQLLKKLKSNDVTRHIPVIMLTARAEMQDRLKALRIGVDDYMTKPFEEEELLVRIENLLKNQSARKKAALSEPTSETTRPQVSQEDQQWLEAFEAYVQQHLSSDILSISDLASTFAMSDSTLLRQLKRLTGLSPLQYLQEMRLDEGRKMLEARRYNSIGLVAAKVGFQDARSFSRSYKQRFGKLPSEVLGE